MADTNTTATGNTLLDLIRNKMANPGAQTSQAGPAVGGQTAQASNLLRAKLTGSAPSASSDVPRQTNLGEQSANATTQAQLGQVADKAQMASTQQGMQSADQEQSAQLAAQQDKTNDTIKMQQFGMQASNLLSDFKRAGAQIRTAEDIQKLQQASFAAKMANNQYISNLKTEAAKSGIRDDLSFNEAYYNQVFGDMGVLLKDKLDFNKILGASDREFNDAISKISIDEAVAIARTAATEANSRAMAQSVGGILAGAGKAASAYYDNKPKTEET